MQNQNFLLLDSAMGTELLKLALSEEVKSHTELANRIDPKCVQNIHAQNIYAGSHFIRTHTFTCNPLSMLEKGFTEQDCFDLIKLSIENAQAASTENTKIVGSIGPMTQYLKNKYKTETKVESYKKIGDTFFSKGITTILFETFSHISELEIALKGIERLQNKQVEIWVSFFQVEYIKRSPQGFSNLLRKYNVKRWGFNCCSGNDILTWLSEVKYEIYPSLFLPNGNDWYGEEVQQKLSQLQTLQNQKVILGGCCGSTHHLISKIANHHP